MSAKRDTLSRLAVKLKKQGAACCVQDIANMLKGVGLEECLHLLTFG